MELLKRLLRRAGRIIPSPLQATPMAVLSYSERHFRPGWPHELNRTSAGQLAMHIWQTLQRDHAVLYADRPPALSCDLLVATDLMRCRGVRASRRILFQPSSHYMHINEMLRNACAPLGLDPVAVDRFSGTRIIDAYNQSLSRANEVVVIGNQQTLETFYAYGPTKQKPIHLLDCGVDLDRFLPANRTADSPVYVFPVSLMSVLKGAPLLLKAWREFRQRKGQGELIILGAESAELDLRGALAAEGITFLGRYAPASDIYLKQLQRAHYVLFPSLAEGQAGTLLEAMSCGCVPMATAASGVNPEEYGGVELAIGSVESIVAALEESSEQLDSWPQKSAFCRQQMERRHRWDLFQERFLTICRPH